MPLSLPPMLVTLTYASRANGRFDEADLSRLVEAAREANQARGVTGMLLYAAPTFVQVLEGEEAVVRALIQRIAADARHRDLKVLDWRALASRAFGRWAMGYVEAERIVGFPGIDRLLLPGSGPEQVIAAPADTVHLLHRLRSVAA